MSSYETKRVFSAALGRLLEKKGITQARLAEELHVAPSSVSGWVSGEKMPRMDKVEMIAELFGVPKSELLEKRHAPPAPTADVITFPISVNVAAHYNALADLVDGESVDIPAADLRGRDPSDFCVMRVKGQSMFPYYLDGDIVLVLLQSTMDYPGQVGVISYGDGEMTIKRINYAGGEDWLELVPLNPAEQPRRIQDAELARCKVIGKPWKLYRDLQ